MLFASRQLSLFRKPVPEVLSTTWTRAALKIKDKSQIALFATLFDSAECLNVTLFYGVPKGLKSCQSWKISEQSVTGVRMEKSRPLERVQLAIQTGYRTTKKLAKRSEIFITSLPNFMTFQCQIFCFLCSCWRQKEFMAKNWVTFASNFSFRPQAPEKRPENRRKTAKFWA